METTATTNTTGATPSEDLIAELAALFDHECCCPCGCGGVGACLAGEGAGETWDALPEWRQWELIADLEAEAEERLERGRFLGVATLGE